MGDDIIQVLRLKASETQKATKFQAPHCLRCLSTGQRSLLVSCVREGDVSTLLKPVVGSVDKLPVSGVGVGEEGRP